MFDRQIFIPLQPKTKLADKRLYLKSEIKYEEPQEDTCDRRSRIYRLTSL